MSFGFREQRNIGIIGLINSGNDND